MCLPTRRSLAAPRWQRFAVCRRRIDAQRADPVCRSCADSAAGLPVCRETGPGKIESITLTRLNCAGAAGRIHLTNHR